MSLEVSATLKRRVSHPFFIFFFCNLSLSIIERRKRTTYESAPVKIDGEKAEENTVPEPAPAKDESCTDSDAKIVGGTEEIGAVKVEGGDKDESRSNDEDDEYGVYRSNSETRHFPQADGYYVPVEFDEIDHAFGSHKVQPEGENVNTKGGAAPHYMRVLICSVDGTDVEPVDFENNGLLWLPLELEDEEDKREAVLFDDDDDEDARGEWGYLRSSSSFGSGECCSRDRSSEEHRKAMKNVVDGHFRASVAQLLQVENLPMGEEDEKENSFFRRKRGRGSGRGLDILTMTPGEKIAVAFNENGQPIGKTTSKAIAKRKKTNHSHQKMRHTGGMKSFACHKDEESKFRQLLAMSGQDESSSSIGDDIYTQVEKWAEIPEHSKEMMWLYIQEHIVVGDERRKWVMQSL
ncbi:hypothetical protein HHK36_032831 [Tetracentron sinense]|uniref:Uncharacterized protein n=1 Tax=Tetracentron sinense TaxID=13715 RepID=A0A834YAA9_TETSI|nr:hypothetical protein HHK36_032831 [Tetracentron sinense]